MTDILEITNIRKTYHTGDETIEALKGISFKLEKGEMLAIMGSSGSGKSTLLHILGALDKPDEGKIYLNRFYEKDYSIEPKATKIRSKNIGFIFQQFNLLNDLTVKENISLPLIINNYKAGRIETAVTEMLKRVGLAEKANHYPKELSGGQQQRVAIARAMITNPKILLADEPTGNLDFNTATDIMQLLKQVNTELGQSTIIVTHDPRIATYTDRVLFFHDGLIKAEYKNTRVDQDFDQILQVFREISQSDEKAKVV